MVMPSAGNVDLLARLGVERAQMVRESGDFHRDGPGSESKRLAGG